MSKFKVFKTSYEDDYGVLETITNGYGQKCVMVCTSSKPQLIGIDATEEFLAEYFSKYRIYIDDEDGEVEERNFDYQKDVPKDWELVEVEIKIIE